MAEKLRIRWQACGKDRSEGRVDPAHGRPWPMLVAVAEEMTAEVADAVRAWQKRREERRRAKLEAEQAERERRAAEVERKRAIAREVARQYPELGIPETCLGESYGEAEMLRDNLMPVDIAALASHLGISVDEPTDEPTEGVSG